MVAAGTPSETVDGRRVCKPSATKGLSISAVAVVWLVPEATHSHPSQDPVVWRTLHLGGYLHQLLQVPKKHLHSTHTESQNYVENSAAWNARCQEKMERKDESLSVTWWDGGGRIAEVGGTEGTCSNPMFIAPKSWNRKRTHCFLPKSPHLVLSDTKGISTPQYALRINLYFLWAAPSSYF